MLQNNNQVPGSLLNESLGSIWQLPAVNRDNNLTIRGDVVEGMPRCGAKLGQRDRALHVADLLLTWCFQSQHVRCSFTNLRNRPLSSSSIDSMDNLILSLYHNLVTGYKDFPYVSVKGFFDSVQVTTPFAHAVHWENAIPSPLTDSPPGVMVPPAGSDFPPQILTPVLPEKAAISVAKADWRNCVHTLDIDGITVTRAISTVYHTEDIEITNQWRVTDYSPEGNVLMSVLCQFLKRSARLAKRKATKEESDSRSPTPPKKRLRV